MWVPMTLRVLLNSVLSNSLQVGTRRSGEWARYPCTFVRVGTIVVPSACTRTTHRGECGFYTAIPAPGASGGARGARLAPPPISLSYSREVLYRFNPRGRSASLPVGLPSSVAPTRRRPGDEQAPSGGVSGASRFFVVGSRTRSSRHVRAATGETPPPLRRRLV